MASGGWTELALARRSRRTGRMPHVTGACRGGMGAAMRSPPLPRRWWPGRTPKRSRHGLAAFRGRTGPHGDASPRSTGVTYINDTTATAPIAAAAALDALARPSRTGASAGRRRRQAPRPGAAGRGRRTACVPRVYLFDGNGDAYPGHGAGAARVVPQGPFASMADAVRGGLGQGRARRRRAAFARLRVVRAFPGRVRPWRPVPRERCRICTQVSESALAETDQLVAEICCHRSRRACTSSASAASA